MFYFSSVLRNIAIPCFDIVACFDDDIRIASFELAALIKRQRAFVMVLHLSFRYGMLADG